MSILKENPECGCILPEETRALIEKNLIQNYHEAKTLEPEKDKNFKNITVDELYSVGKEILAASNVWEAYNILAKPARSGQPYYDLIIAPQHFSKIAALKTVINAIEHKNLKGLDIGAGTGCSTFALILTCSEVTAVDLNPFLLQWAGKKLENCQISGLINHYQIAVMDALSLGFPENCFDIVIVNGIDSYFVPQEINGLYQEIYRVLKRGGRFYKPFGNFAESSVYSSSGKAKLAGSVSQAILSFTYASFYASFNNNIEISAKKFIQKNFSIEGRSFGVSRFIKI